MDPFLTRVRRRLVKRSTSLPDLRFGFSGAPSDGQQRQRVRSKDLQGATTRRALMWAGGRATSDVLVPVWVCLSFKYPLWLVLILNQKQGPSSSFFLGGVPEKRTCLFAWLVFFGWTPTIDFGVPFGFLHHKKRGSHQNNIHLSAWGVGACPLHKHESLPFETHDRWGFMLVNPEGTWAGLLPQVSGGSGGGGVQLPQKFRIYCKMGHPRSNEPEVYWLHSP